MSRRWLSALIRVGVSLVGVIVLVRVVDVRAAVAALAGIRPVGLWGAIALFQVGVLVRAGRWWVLLRPHTRALSVWKLVRLYYIGMFFNLFLPTGFGGDVVRVAELGTAVDGAVSAASVLLDRVIGLMALFCLALAAVPFAVGVVPAGLLWLGAGVSVMGLAGGLVALQGAALRLVIAWLARLPLLRRSVGVLERLHEAVAVVCTDRAAMVWAFGFSMVFNVLLVLMHVVLSAALSLDVPPLAYTLIVPLTSILLLIPSVQGLGVRDLSLVAMVGLFTGQSSGAAALSAAIILQNLISGGIGLVVYGVYIMARPSSKPPKPGSITRD